MAMSDQLNRLAERAKEAEVRAAAAEGKARTELQQDVQQAQQTAQAHADQLRKNTEADQSAASDWWSDTQRSWNEHLAAVRQRVDEKKAEHDLKGAERNATSAEEDAAYAIDYAMAVVEEAEYAVLDATLARKEANELAASAP